MALLSPGVLIREFDNSTVVPQVATSDGALVGQFQWGPVNKVTLVDSQTDLVNTFNTPNSNNAIDWWSASNFLDYTNRLWVVRVVDENNANTSLRATNATAANSAGFLVRNDDHYINNYADGSLKSTYGVGEWIAKFPGNLGNSLKVSICPSAAAYQSTLTGTLSVSANTTAVTGTSTQFTNQVTVGDILVINSQAVKVAAVNSNTSLTLVDRHVDGASANTVVRRWEYYNEVNIAPGTSDYVAGKNGHTDEMHIVVVDEDGSWFNVQNGVLEVFQHVSKASDAVLADGSNNYYKEVINARSKYIRWAGHDSTITNIGTLALNKTFGAFAKPINASLVGGRDGALIGNDERIRGWDYFKNKLTTDISFCIGAGANQTVASYIINNICEYRYDCVAFLSPPQSYVVNNEGDEADDIVLFRNTLPTTSYAMLTCNWKYQYDKFSDVYRWIPDSADVAGLHARTDYQRDAWWPAGGFNRGQIKNVIRFAWTPSEAEMDVLYKNSVNPVLIFPGEGPVLWGNKTLLTKSSAFDRMNVRRLFIVMEKAVAKVMKYFVFELNDEFLRQTVASTLNPYFRDIKGRRGIYDWKVTCDANNNTNEVIDRNELIVDIKIQPARSAEFIYVNFYAMRTGQVDVAETISSS